MFFLQAEDGIRDLVRSRGLGDVYKRQVKQGIYDQLVEMQAAPEIITAYATATGIMSSAQAEAVLQAAAVKVKIEELATAIAAGMPIDKALADLDAFILKMEQGVQPDRDRRPCRHGGLSPARQPEHRSLFARTTHP